MENILQVDYILSTNKTWKWEKILFQNKRSINLYYNQSNEHNFNFIQLVSNFTNFIYVYV